MGLFDEETQRTKISRYCPFNNYCRDCEYFSGEKKLEIMRNSTWKSNKMAPCGSPSSPTTNIMLLDQKSPWPKETGLHNFSNLHLGESFTSFSCFFIFVSYLFILQFMFNNYRNYVQI